MKRMTACRLAIVPSIVLGIAGMMHGGVSTMLWGQQIAALLAAILLSRLPARFVRRVPSGVCVSAFVMILAASLMGEGAGGARRWLDLGVFHVNAAMLLLPAMIALFAGMNCPYPAVLCAAAVLSLQPDLSQLAALGAAALPLLWQGREKKGWSVLVVLGFSVFAIRCVNTPVALEPAPYSEGVLYMLGEISWLVMAAGVLFLALIPGVWLYRFLRERKMVTLSLALYHLVMILFGLTGRYPMPFMGFGLSPIVGYGLGLLLVPEKSDDI